MSANLNKPRCGVCGKEYQVPKHLLVNHNGPYSCLFSCDHSSSFEDDNPVIDRSTMGPPDLLPCITSDDADIEVTTRALGIIPPSRDDLNGPSSERKRSLDDSSTSTSVPPGHEQHGKCKSAKSDNDPADILEAVNAIPSFLSNIQTSSTEGEPIQKDSGMAEIQSVGSADDAFLERTPVAAGDSDVIVPTWPVIISENSLRVARILPNSTATSADKSTSTDVVGTGDEVVTKSPRRCHSNCTEHTPEQKTWICRLCHAPVRTNDRLCHMEEMHSDNVQYLIQMTKWNAKRMIAFNKMKNDLLNTTKMQLDALYDDVTKRLEGFAECFGLE